MYLVANLPQRIDGKWIFYVRESRHHDSPTFSLQQHRGVPFVKTLMKKHNSSCMFLARVKRAVRNAQFICVSVDCHANDLVGGIIHCTMWVVVRMVVKPWDRQRDTHGAPPFLSLFCTLAHDATMRHTHPLLRNILRNKMTGPKDQSLRTLPVNSTQYCAPISRAPQVHARHHLHQRRAREGLWDACEQVVPRGNH